MLIRSFFISTSLVFGVTGCSDSIEKNPTALRIKAGCLNQAVMLHQEMADAVSQLEDSSDHVATLALSTLQSGTERRCKCIARRSVRNLNLEDAALAAEHFSGFVSDMPTRRSDDSWPWVDRWSSPEALQEYADIVETC